MTDRINKHWKYTLVAHSNRTSVTESVTAPGAYDLIFKDGFESGDFSAWSSYTSNADLTVSTQAALFGDYGMKIVVNDNGSLYVTDNTPAAETHYRARFYFRPNLKTMSMTDYHDILIGYQNSMIQPVVFRVEFGHPVGSGTYSLRLGVCLDNGSTWAYSSWYTISNSSHRIEIEWQKATAAGANDGYYRLWLDEDPDASPLIQLTGLDTDLERVESVRLGAANGIDTGTRGTYYFDAFESRKDTPIGAEPEEEQLLMQMEEFDFEFEDVELEETILLTGTETITAELVVYPFDDPFFVFDESGELTGIEEATLDLLLTEVSNSIEYVYDPLSRLTEASYSDGRYLHYSHDANGNRLSEVACLEPNCTPVTTGYEYDIANRLVSVGSTNYTWSDSGNLLSDGVHTYAYDSLNRLTNVSDGSASIEYAYNGRGDMVEQWADLHRTRYSIDLASGLTQVLSDGTTAYLYGNARLGQQSGVEMEYFLTDALGSVRQLADDTAIILVKEYEPYGEVLAEAGNGGSDYGYTGEWTSPYNEFVYLRARWYAVAQGRFLTRDTWRGSQSEPMSYNAWLYAYGNPVNYTDPTGQYAYGGLVHFTKQTKAREWTPKEKTRIYLDIRQVAIAYARAYNQEKLKDFLGECSPLTNYRINFPGKIPPLVAFLRVHNGPVTIERRSASATDYWGEAQSINLIYIYNNVTNEDIETHPRFIVHEMGHVFENALYDVYGKKLGRSSINEDLWWRNYEEETYGGFRGGSLLWQFSNGAGGYNDNGTPDDLDDDTDGRGEIFADMFIGWVYNAWEIYPNGQLTDKGSERANHMNDRMPLWIYKTINVHGGY